MADSAVERTVEHSNQRISREENETTQSGKNIIFLKLLLVGICLPAFDLVTDIIAIKQYWASSQWIFNYLAYALILSLLLHNCVSSWYGWRNYFRRCPQESKSGVFFSLRKYGRCICFAMGVGDIQVAIETLQQLSFSKNIDQK